MTAPDPTWRGDDSFGWLRSLSQPHLDTAGVAPELRRLFAAYDQLRGATEDPIETNIEAAFGEIEELRRQLATAEAERDEANGDRDSALQLWQQLVRQRAAVLAYLDDCDNGMGSVQAAEVRRALGATEKETA